MQVGVGHVVVTVQVNVQPVAQSAAHRHRTQDDQHQGRGELERQRQPLGEGGSQEDRRAAGQPDRQRVPHPPGHPVDEGAAQSAPGFRQRRHRSDVVGIQRMPQSQDKPERESGQHWKIRHQVLSHPRTQCSINPTPLHAPREPCRARRAAAPRTRAGGRVDSPQAMH